MTHPLDPLSALLEALRPSAVPDATLLDLLTAHAALLVELHQTRRLLVDAALPSSARAEGDELRDLGARARRALLLHPIAGQALFASLVEEGRRAAETHEGARRLDEIRRSPALAQFAPLWEVIAGSLLQPEPDVVLPTAWVDGLVALASQVPVEDLLWTAEGREP